MTCGEESDFGPSYSHDLLRYVAGDQFMFRMPHKLVRTLIGQKASRRSRSPVYFFFASLETLREEELLRFDFRQLQGFSEMSRGSV